MGELVQAVPPSLRPLGGTAMGRFVRLPPHRLRSAARGLPPQSRSSLCTRMNLNGLLLGDTGMTEHREKSIAESGDEPKPFADFAMVRLKRPARGLGVLYPAGSVGVVVDRHEDGIAYEVEFDSPMPGIATV